MQWNLRASWTFYSFCQGSLKNKLVFTHGLYCFPTCVVVQLMHSVSSRAASSWKRLCWPLGAGAQSNHEGRKWRGGVWMWHKQETSFVFPPAQRCTRKVYSKRCPCAIYFVGLSKTECSARSLHNRHCWKMLIPLYHTETFWNRSLITFLSSLRCLCEDRSVFNGRSGQNAIGSTGNAS